MVKLLRFLKNAETVLITTAAVFAAAIVAVETYQELCKRVEAARKE